MLIGEDYWNASIVADMVEISEGKRQSKTYPDLTDSVYTILVETEAKFGSKVALCTENDESYTYSDLLHLVDRLAEKLAALGAGRGDRVGLILENSVEFAASFFAINSLGALTVPLPCKFRKPEIQRLAARAGLKVAILEETYSDWLDLQDGTSPKKIILTKRDTGLSLADHIDISDTSPRNIDVAANRADDAVLMYSSGTTSLAKGVLLTNQNISHAVSCYQRVLDLNENDSSIIAAPIFYVTGMLGLLTLFTKIGGTIHLQRRFNCEKMLTVIDKHQLTFLHASPTIFSMLLAERGSYESLPSVRTIVCGGAYMPVDQIKALHNWMPKVSFRTAYGMTETASPGTIFPSDAATSDKLGSAGIPFPGVRIDIRDSNGVSQDHQKCGEIWISGTNITRAYDGLESPDLSENGWLRTGDVGYTTEDGYLYIVDRTKDAINRGGEKIWSLDVEEELRRIDAVKTAAVFGIADAKYGEVAVSAIVLEKGMAFDEKEIRDQLSTRMAKYKIPQHFFVVEALPLTSNLKIDKNALRNKYARLSGSSAA
nr:class I adenylate-forming enzyme family protein [uncultured Cohaesibacter sp.]